MNYKSYITNEGNIDADGPDIVYYNLDIISGDNNEKQLGGDSNILRFSETRSTPIINNISKYYFSIIRFSMNGPNKDLPLCCLPIKRGQSNINLTNLKISISMLKGSLITPLVSTKDVIYVSESLDAFTNSGTSLPNAPTNNVDRRGIYYWIYTYDHFTKLINTTIQSCFTELQTLYNAAAGTTNVLINTQPAKLVYNENSKLFDFYFDCKGWSDLSSCNNSIGSGTPNNEIFKMSFNTDLYNLLSNFDYKNVGIIGTSLPYQIQISNKNYKNYFAPSTLATNLNPQPSTAGYIVMSQNYESTSSLWSPISSIVFTSGTIPLVSEGVAAPTIFSDNTDGNTTSNAFQPIITDIALGMDTGASAYREFLSYVPSGEYRLSSFTSSNQPLSQIDLQIYWKNRLDLNLYPIAMPAYSSTSIKIMFRKKHL